MLAVSIDGQLISDLTQATIPVNDHGLLYGDGVFEGLRFYNGKVFRWQAHFERLLDSARAIGLRLPATEAALKADVEQCISAAGLADGYVRLLVTRGSGPLGVNPAQCRQPRTVVIVDHLAMVSEASRQRGIKAIIAGSRRLEPDQLDPRIKSLNYLNQVLARMEANAAGAEEAILLNRAGRVAEGTADNVFIVKQGQLLTPPVTEGALNGITRNVIIEVARQLSVPCTEQPLTVYDLYTADECFLTGTGAELIPVAELSQRQVGDGTPGPVFQQLQRGFEALVKAETSA
ncbi:MAG: branched-chain-amino-acid transaminase [Pseudomonadales bacterium]|nr:branched-chain-amino-acid transaminase [Pseudomonadales bacterium]